MTPLLPLVLALAGGIDPSALPPPPPGPLAPPGPSAPPPPPPSKPTGIESPFRVPPLLFRERSYLFSGVPDPGPPDHRAARLFEASVVANFPIYDDLQDRVSRFVPQEGWSRAFSFTFQLRLRMLRDASSPIQMPSYMPRLEFQLLRVWPWQIGGRFRILGLTYGLNHHSNGQYGCPYQAGLDRPACAPARDAPDLPERLNRRRGDFGSNTLSFDVRHQSGTLDDNGYVHRAWTWGARAELQVPGAGGLETEEVPLYGLVQLRPLAEYLYELEGGQRLRFEGAVEASLGAGAHVPWLRGWLEAALTWRNWGGFGFFTRLYGGRDYYNAFYVDAIWQLHLGVTFDLTSPLHFGPG